MRKFSLGFSPCPNDTFIFDAMVHQKIQHDYHWDLHLEDVETLNEMAVNKVLDISKISIHAYFLVADKYRLLDSGAALGRGNGPLVVGKNKSIPQQGKVALPGEMTTANLLFQMAYPGQYEPVFMQFDQIIPAVLKGEVDFGVIIHESRFTYQNEGLTAYRDLGRWWEETTGLPLPLGGIMVSRDLDADVQADIEKKIKESIEFAEANPGAAQGFIKDNAQELDDQVISSHIGLYVNDFSKSLGEEGKNAVTQMYERALKAGVIQNPVPTESLFSV